MKLFRLILLTVITVCISATLTLGQSKGTAKMQAPREYAHYEKTWFKKEMKNLKEVRADKKNLLASPKKRSKRVKKLDKIRTDIAELSARKEGSND